MAEHGMSNERVRLQDVQELTCSNSSLLDHLPQCNQMVVCFGDCMLGLFYLQGYTNVTL